MRVMLTTMAAAAALLASGPATAQTAAPAEWRTVAPENLLVIETSKGRVLVELDPRVAPVHVERIRALADQGFYDGLKFHRVLPGFMAQTGDPLGTGEGGSELPDINAEFEFRRGRADGFVRVQDGENGRQQGYMGSMAVVTQPDAQMMVTADFKTSAHALFCPGVVGMAHNENPNSANSQFFLMTAHNENLDGVYTPFGRVVAGLDVVRALKPGSEADNGAVTDPDVMTRVRTAAALPEAGRPAVRVLNPASAAFAEQLATARGAGSRVDICAIQPQAEVVG